MNSKEDSELTLHLLSSGRSSSGGSHRHVGGVRCSGCGMSMGSSNCGTVGCLLGLVVVRIAQLGQCRRGHVRRGEGIRIRVPCNGKRAKKKAKRTSICCFVLCEATHTSFASPLLSCTTATKIYKLHTRRMIMSGGTNGQKMNITAIQNMTKKQGKRL